MRAPDLRWLVLLLGGLACSGRQEPAVRPSIDPGRIVPPPVVPPPPPPPPAEPVLPPMEAFQRGLMPLVSTNVWAYRQSNPGSDGRGVLIGILDSGIDAAVTGLATTSTGEPKLLDLRDFSGEGRVELTPLTVAGDSAAIEGRTLRGVSRLAAVAGAGTFYGGVLRELPLGELPASDVNGDGDNADQLPLVVGRASDGWVLFADTDGDGSLANEQPVHDYLVAKETFGWRTAGRPSPLAVAANFGAGGDSPSLNLFFDTSGHGTHVAGIAAGSNLYGVEGFDGVAPGAQLLGLKIANNAFGGISVTGSMIRAIDYAIRFAAERKLPLVLNMSFGVGNEREGTARIDAIIDSVLAANPDLVFTTSAGNDGPGLSTLGFPGSADRVISVGATIPPAFIGAAAVASDVIAFFSSRGGETAKPDILAPGIAYSSVPRWDTGSEDKNGTSMAAPHVAGAIALMISTLERDKVSWTAAQLKQAVVASARSMGSMPRVDQGSGLLDVIAAERLVRRLPAVAAVRVKVGGVPGGGVLRISGSGRAADTSVVVEVEGALGGPVRLTSNAAWLSAPGGAQLTPPKTTFAITVRGSSVRGPGMVAGTITGWATDTTIGPLFRIPVTLVNPFPIADSGLVVRSTLTAGAAQRVFFAADSGRPFAVEVGANRGQAVLAFLHEPGGQPFRTDNGRPGGFGEQAARYDVDGREVVPGFYEAVAVASPEAGASVQVTVTQSPVELDGARTKKDTVTATIGNLTGRDVVGTAMLGLVGAERGIAFSQRGSAERRIPIPVPRWARRMVVDLQLSRSLWPLFTDLGLSILDARGQILTNDPLNYSFGRAAVDLDSAQTGQDAVVVIAPGFADPAADRLWDANLAIRFYAETPVLVETPVRTEFTLAPGADVTFRFPLTRIPWPLGDAFFPLGQLVAEVGGATWGRELRLHEPLPPVMR